MTTPEQTECETYRVVVLGQSGTKVLVVPDGDRFALPSVNIPRWQRVAENVATAVKAKWGQEVVCILEPDVSPASGIEVHYQTAEHCGSRGAAKMPTRWVPVSTLSHDSLIDVSDHFAVQQSVALGSAERMESPAGPFARLGWLKELRGWVATVIEPLGFHLNGNFRQLNASPSFSLIRFETDGPAVWFKAVGEPNQREFPITRTLAKLFPRYLPGMFASRQEWNGWLMREVEGRKLDECQETACWERAVAALAELQNKSIGYGPQLLAEGARDLGAAELSKLICPFFEAAAILMEQQTKVPPAVLGLKELRLLGKHIQNAIEALGSLGIPEALGHLDLNPGNVIVSPERCAFLDWSEAYVGNPLFSLEYLLEHARRTLGSDSAVRTRLTAAYCAQWDGVVSAAVIADALAFAPLLAAFAYAAGNDVWKDTARLEEPATAGYLRSLARRMHREANALADRGTLCLD